MLGNFFGVSRLYMITGRTDTRLSIDELMAIIRYTYRMDPYANALYLLKEIQGKIMLADKVRELFVVRHGN